MRDSKPEIFGRGGRRNSETRPSGKRATFPGSDPARRSNSEQYSDSLLLTNHQRHGNGNSSGWPIDSQGTHAISAQMPSPISLNGRRVTQTFVCCLVVTVLALSHIQLRFMINDMRLQHQRMQNVHRGLVQENRLLERNSAMLSDPSRLNDFARGELKMVDTRERITVSIPAALRQKYDPVQLAKSRDAINNQKAVSDSSLKEFQTVANVRLRKFFGLR
jgi:hypothetical protein